MVLEEGSLEFHNLPEDCIANILSLTTPRDVGRISLVSSTFKSVAESDAVWDRFLPSDYQSIISQCSTDDYELLCGVHSKKQLYLNLCQKPLLIDDGKKSFQLDKIHGKKCYMLSARNLFIVWGDTPMYWRWISLPDTRFSEVAELVSVCWLEIRGWINTSMLSPNTLYEAYLVFKLSRSGTYGFEYQTVEVSVGIAGGDTHKKNVFLDAERERRLRYQIVPRRNRPGLFNRARFVEAPPPPTESVDEMQEKYPKQRENGWLEIELGEFFNEGGEGKEVEMGVYEIKGGDWKGGLLVQGIEIRPRTKP